MHNGYLNEFATIKRDLISPSTPVYSPFIQGQADTEVLVVDLALTFGLEDYPGERRRAGGGASSRRSPSATTSHTRSRGRSPPATAISTWVFLELQREEIWWSFFFTTDVPMLRRHLDPERI